MPGLRQFPILVFMALAALVVLPANAAVTLADRAQLIDMLKQGQFDALEEALARYQAEFKAGQRSEWDVNKAYGAFQTSAPAVTAGLDAWVAARPNSAAARLARGSHKSHVAWLVRGAAFVSQTHPARFEEMHRLLALATADLAGALEADPTLSVAYGELIQIVKAQGDRSTIERLYHEGVAMIPASAVIRFAYLGSLEPRWQSVPLPLALAQMKSAIDEIEFSFGGHPDFRGLEAYRESILADWLNGQGDLAGGSSAPTRPGRTSNTRSSMALSMPGFMPTGATTSGSRIPNRRSPPIGRL